MYRLFNAGNIKNIKRNTHPEGKCSPKQHETFKTPSICFLSLYELKRNIEPIQKDKKMPAKNHSIGKGSKTLNHLLKFDEVGMTSDKGQRFTDRNILGKNKLNTKMTGLSIFINA